MKRIVLSISLLLCLMLLLLAGCSDHHNDTLTTPVSGGTGSIGFTVNWPTDTAAATKTIPSSAKSIVITITQNGQTIGTPLTIERPTSDGHLDNVPVGETKVTGEAKDASGAIVASGSTTVTVVANQRVPAALHLTGLNGPEMVWVPAGTFTMGSPDVEMASEYPPHQVTLSSGYWIYKYEVTVAQYRAFCSATGHVLPVWPGEQYSWAGKTGWNDPTLQQHPIVNVSWDDAKAYAEWAGASLPTEAQWEYAARGSAGRCFPWGGLEIPGDPSNGWDATKCACWVNSRDVGISTWPVGSFPAGTSWCGAQDLAGNVSEWCSDWYYIYPSTPVTDPTCLVTGTIKVCRGGSWLSGDALTLHCTYRTLEPNQAECYFGFRCVVKPLGS